MEGQFWDVFTAHPGLIIILIVGGVIALSSFLSASAKVHDLLGFKTKGELKEERISTILLDLKGIRDELQKRFEAQDQYNTELKASIDRLQDTEIMLLGDRLTIRSQYYLRLGYIPAEEVVEYQSMYDTYKLIGGNHGVDTLFQKTVESLPIGRPNDDKEDEAE